MPLSCRRAYLASPRWCVDYIHIGYSSETTWTDQNNVVHQGTKTARASNNDVERNHAKATPSASNTGVLKLSTNAENNTIIDNTAVRASLCAVPRGSLCAARTRYAPR